MVGSKTATTPVPPKLPPAPPSSTSLNEQQWAMLLSILDAIVPSIVSDCAPLHTRDPMTTRPIRNSEYQAVVNEVTSRQCEPPSHETFAAYLEERPSVSLPMQYAIRRTLSTINPGARSQLRLILWALSTRAGSIFLTGSATPLDAQPILNREATVQCWSACRLATPRLLATALANLAKVSWLSSSALLRQVTGYSDVPLGWKPGPDAKFSFLQFPAASASSEPSVLETDVVVIGSSFGGGVCARTLSQAGHRVVVVDKGFYFPPRQLPMPQAEGMHHLFENHGVVQTDDSSVHLVAGSCWGGGGTVNWSACLQTQGFVRREWAEQNGLPFFATAAFQASLDRVCEFVGAALPVRQNRRGQVLLDGARKLGWHAQEVPQNTGEQDHWCGHCHLGCGSGVKRSAGVCWLPEAGRLGAQFVEGMEVERILWDEKSKEKRAVGIMGRWTSRDMEGGLGQEGRRTAEVVIRAKKVILSAGSLCSPLILLNSGLRNRNIGYNLHLHPVNIVGAYYDEDVRPWEGGILTSVCTSFENLDGRGHGVKLEGMNMTPYSILSQLPWLSGLDFKRAAARFRHLSAFIALTRDRDSGRVGPTSASQPLRPLVSYTPSPFDAAHTLEGVIALCQICHVTGAREIRAFLPGSKPFIREHTDDKSGGDHDLGVADPNFTAWLAELRALGNPSPATPFSSAHQMGTCRMGAHESAGVVDQRGRVWEARGLYVADASVLPSASGVNPMVTTMAVAEWIARGVVADLEQAER